MHRLATALLALLLSAPGTPLTGTVVDEADRPIAGARVRMRAAPEFVLSGVDGRFVIADPRAAPGAEITAALPGHLIGGITTKDGVYDYRVTVRPVAAGDDRTYPWVSAFPEDELAPRTDFGREPCGACHRRILGEWLGSSHARSAANPRFRAFLRGGDGLSLARDDPGNAGSCVACHIPMEAAGPVSADAVAGEGVGCDFCHKISEVSPAGTTREGALAVALRRPPFGRQTVFGPFDDVPRGRDAFAPVFAESRFCAACHQSRAGDVAIYSEFDEWRISRYARDGVTCQSCHMRGDGGATAMSDLGPGRISRDPATLSSHRFHDSRSPNFLADAIDLSLDTHVDGDDLVVTVEVANRGAGHRLPAGSPMRHMLLVVAATSDGKSLDLIEGPVLPTWSGGDLSGRPGHVYAKLLRDLSPEPIVPAPFWRPVALESDSRVPPDSSDRRVFRFRTLGSSPATVDARLLIRRTFDAWAKDKGLGDNEIMAAEASVAVR